MPQDGHLALIEHQVHFLMHLPIMKDLLKFDVASVALIRPKTKDLICLPKLLSK